MDLVKNFFICVLATVANFPDPKQISKVASEENMFSVRLSFDTTDFVIESYYGKSKKIIKDDRYSYSTSYTVSLPDTFDSPFIFTNGNDKMFMNQYLLRKPSISCQIIRHSKSLEEQDQVLEEIDSLADIKGEDKDFDNEILKLFNNVKLFSSMVSAVGNKPIGLLKRESWEDRSFLDINIALELFTNNLEDNCIQTYIHHTSNYPVVESNNYFFFFFTRGIKAFPYTRDFSIIIMMGNVNVNNNENLILPNNKTNPHTAVFILDHKRFLSFETENNTVKANYLYMLDTDPSIYQLKDSNQANPFLFGNYASFIICLNRSGITIQEPWSCTVIATEFAKILNKKSSITDFIEYDGNDDPVCFKREVMEEVINNISELENKSGVKILIEENREQILNQFLSNFR